MAYQVEYVGESPQGLVTDSIERATKNMMRDIATQARDVMHTTAAASTPVRTGVVRESWIQEPIAEGRDEEGRDRIEAKVSNSHWIAPMLNYGTEAHEIDPKQRRAELTPEGPRRRSHVSGIRPHHMIEHATSVAGAVIEPISYEQRTRWKLEVERESISGSAVTG